MNKIDFRVALPNLITILGLCLGLNSLKFAFEGNFEKSITFIVLAAILDTLDGRIARFIKGTSKFGAELDSLTDFVNFGVCPGLIVYFWALNSFKFFGWIITLLFVVACCLRLARFNIDTGLKSEKENWRINFFTGVPAPAGAGLILMPLIVSFSDFNYLFENILNNQIILSLMVFVSFLMISKIPTYAFKKIKISKSIFILLALSLVLFFGLLFNKMFETLTVLGIVYFLSIPISFVHFLRLKKYKERVSKKTDSLISDEII